MGKYSQLWPGTCTSLMPELCCNKGGITMSNHDILIAMGALVLAGAMALGGCNSTGSTTSSASGNTITGVITGFGSVYVNGVEFSSNDAKFTVDGAPGASDYDLGVGMRVTVEGTVNPDGVTGTATSISFADDLEGVVMNTANLLPDGTGTMDIMGQTVTLNKLTVFNSDVQGIAAVTDIGVGNVVEVSGFSAGLGSIVASRIEVKAADLASYLANNPGARIELKGLVTGNDPINHTFSIGALSVDYSSAFVDGLPSDPVQWDGLYVEVKSVFAPVDNGDGTYSLAATKVALEGDGNIGITSASGEDVEARGMITSVSSASDFMLDGQLVSIAPGSDSSDNHITSVDASLIGSMVEVEGYIDDSGVLQAHSVQLEDGSSSSLAEFKDYVQGIDVANGTVTLQGGQVIFVTNNTIKQDSQSSNAQHYFDLYDLRSGDYVEIYAFTNANGDLEASKLEREDPPVI
jgi:hypothetical protein